VSLIKIGDGMVPQGACYITPLWTICEPRKYERG